MTVRAGRMVAWLLALVLFVCVLVVVAQRLAPTVRDVWDPRPPEACTEADPTTGGCLTPTALRLHDRTVATFGPPGPGAPVRALTCWAERPWNPGSDHPAGRACDVFPTRSGTFPEGAELAAGWAVANWFRDNARELDVRYVIWQGRIWVRGRDGMDGRDGGGDPAGWGRPYSGGGVYDPADATGGHYDHVHVSVGP